MRLGEVISFLEELFPLEWAEDWDRVGLVVGDPDWDVKRIRLAVDPTLAEARIAAQSEGTLLITHHPLLMRGANYVSTETGKGKIVTDLIGSRSALWCGHTNTDRSVHGTVGAWIRLLDLDEAEPLEQVRGSHNSGGGFFGLGAVGTLKTPETVGELAERISRNVPHTAQGVLFTGDPDRAVRRVAVCPGAGDSFLDQASAHGVDVYITSDLRHHPALEHVESKADESIVPALIDLPHYASEYLYLPHLAQILGETFPDLSIEVSKESSDPFAGVAR